MQIGLWSVRSTCALVMLSGAIAQARDASTANFPVIDGKIEEREWENAGTLDNFFTVVPKTGHREEDITIALVKQSSAALYFAFKFHPRSKVIRGLRHKSWQELRKNGMMHIF